MSGVVCTRSSKCHQGGSSPYSDEQVANRNAKRRDREWSLNDGQIPNPNVVRVAPGTRYHRVEGNRRAWRNGPVKRCPTTKSQPNRYVGFRVGDRSRGRFATPADFPRHDGTPYRRLRARRWGLGFVHRSRTIFCRAVPNLSVTIRNFCIAVGWGWRGESPSLGVNMMTQGALC